MTSEIKFVVDAALGGQIAEWARGRLSPDPHGSGPCGDQYRITSVYLDTPERDVFHRRGSYGRSKYRIRRYETEPTVFLERKLRTGTRLAKRRTSVGLEVLPAVGNGASPGESARWFQRRMAVRRLQPVCQVSYARIARVGQAAHGAVRLTIDEGLSAISTGTLAFATGSGAPLLDGRMILELKYSGCAPAVFRELVETFGLTPGAASKYRMAVDALGTHSLHA